jgi:uncharacterized protein (DUF58 family)
MPTRSFWVLAGLIFGLCVVGVVTLRAEVLALALPLLAYLAFGVWTAPREVQLSARRSLSTDRITQGRPVAVEVEVVLDGPQVEEAHLADQLVGPAHQVEGEPDWSGGLTPAAPVTIAYQLTGQRGRFRFEGLQAQLGDAFGLFAADRFVPSAGELLVYPEVGELRPMPIRPPQTKGFSGPIPARRGGTGMDFFGVRAYQLGDALRHINWRTSARHTRDLFTNEFEQERIADVGLILDARPQGNLPVGGRTLFDYAVEATAALAQMFLDEGHCLSLLIYGAGIGRVFPGYGKRQRERVMQALARAETGLNFGLERLRYLPVRLLPPRCQLVYVSPLGADDLEPLVRFRTQGYGVLALGLDAIAAERATFPAGAEDLALGARYARVERALLFSRLRAAGVQVLDWRVDQALGPTLERVRALPHRRGGG